MNRRFNKEKGEKEKTQRDMNKRNNHAFNDSEATI